MNRLLVLALLALPLAGCMDDAPTDDATLPPPPPATEDVAPRVWPDLATATVRPGVKMMSSGGQCTSNFVFTTPLNDSVYIGFAAHCVGSGAATDTNGCDPVTGPLPLGTKIEIQGASKPGVLVYTSWGTMQAVGEADADTCAYNDFALVQVDPEDVALVHPAVLEFGGPTALASADNVSDNDKVVSYGNSGLRPEAGGAPSDRKEGYVLSTDANGWTHRVYMLSPGVPGDSGSNLLLASGEALGVVVTVGLLPVPLANGVTNLEKALAYANEHSGYTFELATAELLDAGVLPALP